MHRFRLTILRAAVATFIFVALWVVLTLTVGGIGFVDVVGWTLLYLIGLAWVQFLVEQGANRIEARRDGRTHPRGRIIWNPLDPASLLFRPVIGFGCCLLFAGIALVAALPDTLRGEELSSPRKALAVATGCLAMASLATAVAQSRRLRQSVSMLTAYTLLFALLYILVHWKSSSTGELEYEIPAGGSDSAQASTVKVQKVVRTTYVINPHSSIAFSAPPPIDKVELNLDKETANQFKAGTGTGGGGKGKGKGSGFGSGTGSGSFVFVRLRHSDRNWNKNLGIDGDYNLLIELKSRYPAVKIAPESTAIDTTTIASMSARKPLPLLYICGTHGFSPTPAEKRILKEYLIDKHGMILGDNLGGPGFHNSFVAAMNEITGTSAKVIQRDDRIHQHPFELPLLPIVVAHGGTAPLGWMIDGRWAVYYHPGALSDAWRSDHSGIKPEVYKLCYELGFNILEYANAEQESWRNGQQK